MSYITGTNKNLIICPGYYNIVSDDGDIMIIENEIGLRYSLYSKYQTKYLRPVNIFDKLLKIFF